MSVSFKELSAWISAFVIGGFGVWYFLKLGTIPDGASIAALLLTAVIGIIFWEILLHIAIAIWHRPEKADERDTLIAARARRNAYYVMMAGVVTAIELGLWAGGSLSSPMIVAGVRIGALNLLVLTIFAAEIFNYGSQALYYRLGS